MDNETPRRRRLIGAIALFAAGSVAGVALGLTGGATAQAPTPTESSAPGEAAPDGGKRKGMRGGGKGPGARGHGGPGIHGEFVVPKAGGGYQTMTTQKGDVTAVSPTSISVRSEDGFTATYVVTPETIVNSARDGISTVEVGDEVHVAGVKDGGTTTAIRIADRTKLEEGRRRFAPAPQASPAAA